MGAEEVFTLQKVREAAFAIVASMPPGFAYTRDVFGACWYGPMLYLGGTAAETGCLVGRIIERLDPELYERVKYLTGDVASVRREVGLACDDNAVSYMQELQYRQDDGVPWVECLMKAEETQAKFDRLRAA